MYNLLVTMADGAWDGSHYIVHKSRFLEFTDEGIAARLGELDEKAVDELKALPSLFAYESQLNEPARVGWITSIESRRENIRIAFQIDATIPAIQPDVLEELAWELDIGSMEMTRSHWAVKDVSLLYALRGHAAKAGDSTTVPKVTYMFSRKTILRACDFLGTLFGHAEFDKFLLEIGIDDINAGRDRGSLLSRANALAQYVLANPSKPTAEGEPLSLVVARRAAQLDPEYPNGERQPLTGTVRTEFWTWLKKDGYALIEGDIVSDGPPRSEASPPVAHPPSRQSMSFPPSGFVRSYAPPPASTAMSKTNPDRVFIVHGRDNGSKHEVARFLEKLKLEPVILHERPSGGRTLISKFQEESADIKFAVVLMTPDDVGGLRGETPKSRARQNVIFELGFFIGKLGPQNVCALVAGEIETPSDFDAIVYVAYGSNTPWKNELARELRHAGIAFDPANIL